MSHTQPPYPPQQPPPGGPPPPPGGYGGPPPGGYGAAPGGGVPGSYSPIDAVKYGWTAFTRNVAPFLGLTALLLGLGLAVNLLTNLLTTGSVFATGGDVDPATGLPENYWAMQLFSMISGLLAGAISWVIGLALMRGALDVVDTGTTNFSAMFTRIPWGHALLAGILVALATTVGLVLCILPGIAVAFLLYYSSIAVLDGNSAVDALKASYRFTTGHLGETLLLALVLIGLGILALCTCGIGLLVLTPVANLAVAYTWRVLQGRPVA